MRVLEKIVPLISNFIPNEGGNWHTCAYCILADHPYLIDSGNPGDVSSQFLYELKLNGVDINNLGGVLATHSHIDHAGGAIELHEKGIPLMLHKDEAYFMEHLPEAFDYFFGPSFYAIGQEEFISNLRNGTDLGYITGPCKVDFPLKDNEIIELSNDIHMKVIPIPGHTCHSVGYYWLEKKAIFTGDAIQGLGMCIGTLPIIQNPLAYEQSCKKLMDMDIQIMLTGHMFQSIGTHGVTANNVKYQPEINNFLLESLEIHNIIWSSVYNVVTSKGNCSFTELIIPIMDSISKQIPIHVDYHKPIERPYNFPLHWLDTLVSYYFAIKEIQKN